MVDVAIEVGIAYFAPMDGLNLTDRLLKTFSPPLDSALITAIAGDFPSLYANSYPVRICLAYIKCLGSTPGEPEFCIFGIFILAIGFSYGHPSDTGFLHSFNTALDTIMPLFRPVRTRIHV